MGCPPLGAGRVCSACSAWAARGWSGGPGARAGAAAGTRTPGYGLRHCMPTTQSPGGQHGHPSTGTWAASAQTVPQTRQPATHPCSAARRGRGSRRRNGTACKAAWPCGVAGLSRSPTSSRSLSGTTVCTPATGGTPGTGCSGWSRGASSGREGPARPALSSQCSSPHRGSRTTDGAPPQSGSSSSGRAPCVKGPWNHSQGSKSLARTTQLPLGQCGHTPRLGSPSWHHTVPQTLHPAFQSRATCRLCWGGRSIQSAPAWPTGPRDRAGSAPHASPCSWRSSSPSVGGSATCPPSAASSCAVSARGAPLRSSGPGIVGPATIEPAVSWPAPPGPAGT